LEFTLKGEPQEILDFLYGIDEVACADDEAPSVHECDGCEAQSCGACFIAPEMNYVPTPPNVIDIRNLPDDAEVTIPVGALRQLLIDLTGR
jgi:hypothetical protein